MAFCNYCGAALPAGAQFCHSCGRPIIVPPAVPPPLGSPPSGALNTPVYARAVPVAAPVTFPPIPPPPDLPFAMQEGEVLYREIVPHPRLFWRLALYLFGAIAGPIALIAFAFAFSFAITIGFVFTGVLFAGFLGILFVASLVAAAVAFPKYRYWVTSQRTVGRRGIVGYSIDSVPLETVSNLVIYRGILDRILGLSSLFIEPFGGGGHVAGRQRGGITGINTFLGLRPADVSPIQYMVLHLRDVRRRETGRLF